jgi:hypothetical protein
MLQSSANPGDLWSQQNCKTPAESLLPCLTACNSHQGDESEPRAQLCLEQGRVGQDCRPLSTFALEEQETQGLSWICLQVVSNGISFHFQPVNTDEGRRKTEGTQIKGNAITEESKHHRDEEFDGLLHLCCPTLRRPTRLLVKSL